MPRVSLRKIDAMLNGELGAEEASRLWAEIGASPELRDYFERQRALQSKLGWDRLRRAVGKDKRFASRQARIMAWIRDRLADWGRVPALWGAIGAMAALALAVAFWSLRDAHGPGPANRLASKGLPAFEAQIQIHGQAFGTGSLLHAGPGDTLGFTYRSQDSVNVQVWYREDGGKLTPFAGKSALGFTLPPVTAWTVAPQSILLEGAWRRQEVWMVLSRHPLHPYRAQEAIRKGSGAEGVRVFAFRLSRRD